MKKLLVLILAFLVALMALTSCVTTNPDQGSDNGGDVTPDGPGEGGGETPDAPETPDFINALLTVDSLGIASETYLASTATVSGVGFEFVQIGNYGSGIQMRDSEKGTSMLWNTSAFGKGIKEIKLVYSANKDVKYANADAVIFNFGNSQKGADYTAKLSTEVGVKEYTVTPNTDTYTYLYIEHDLGYSFYWESITIVFADGTTTGAETPDAPGAGGDQPGEGGETPDTTDGCIVINGQKIPYYNGSADYVVLNGNKPFFEDGEIKQSAWWSYSPLDSLGRATGAFACICRDTMPTDDRENISSMRPTGWSYNNQYAQSIVPGQSLYNRSHLLAHSLMSDDVHIENFVTGTQNMNQKTMQVFENQVLNAAKSGDYIMYRITPIYEGNNLVCTGVLMEAYSSNDGGDSVEFCVFLYNIQPGIVIDYTSGANKQGDPTGLHSSNIGADITIGTGASNPGTTPDTPVIPDTPDTPDNPSEGGTGGAVNGDVVFDFGAKGSAAHVDGSTIGETKTYTEGGHSLIISNAVCIYDKAYDLTGNSCLKVGTSSKIGSFAFTVGENVAEVIINVAAYKAKAAKIEINGVAYEPATSSNNGEYTSYRIDTTVNKTVNFTTVATGYRVMINSIEFVFAK